MHRESVYGPYKHRNGYRVEVHAAKGGSRQKTRRTFVSEEEALEFKRGVEREIRRSQDADALRARAGEHQRLAEQYASEADRHDGRSLTLADAMERYRAYMLDEKGNKPKSAETTLHRLRGVFGDCSISLGSITERKAASIYEARRQKVAVDTHRNELGQVKTFLEWCREQGWIHRNPFAKVKGVGKRSCGKEQLRIAETRRVVEVAFAQARLPRHGIRRREAGHRESSLAVLVALYLALRAGEVVNIRRRDVDDGGRLLWIPDSKTANGRRTLEVAKVLQPLLWQRALECGGGSGDDPDARLFPHCRDWVLYNVKRLCREAGVPEVTAHAARGIHATIATQMGATSQLVAVALGHGSTEVTRRHYIGEGATEQATRDRFQTLLADASADTTAGEEALATRGKGSSKSFPRPESQPEAGDLDWPKCLESIEIQGSAKGGTRTPTVAH